MTSPIWQLHQPINAITFDCDGTLSAIEGIDELAKLNGVSSEVESLTAEAMGKSGINPDLYQKRLNLVMPKQNQLSALGHQYFANQVSDAAQVIQMLKRLGKTIYIVSAGLFPAVKIFGELLQIPQQNIFAVDIYFDTEGNYLDYDQTSPLIHNHGKRNIVTHLKSMHQQIIHVGDGLNDLITHDLVTRFIGYGGVFYRENIASSCPFYIHTLSIASLLPFVLTPHEYEKLTPTEQVLYHKGLAAL